MNQFYLRYQYWCQFHFSFQHWYRYQYQLYLKYIFQWKLNFLSNFSFRIENTEVFNRDISVSFYYFINRHFIWKKLRFLCEKLHFYLPTDYFKVFSAKIVVVNFFFFYQNRVLLLTLWHKTLHTSILLEWVRVQKPCEPWAIQKLKTIKDALHFSLFLIYLHIKKFTKLIAVHSKNKTN